MGRPLITLDLDGVLCRPPLGINPGRRKAKNRHRPGRRNLLWLTERWRYRGRRPMPGAVEDFRRLREQFDCQVVSARSEKARKHTEKWFRRHFGEVPIIHLRPSYRETSSQFKVRKMAELQPIAHFEDDPHTAHWIAETLLEVFLVDWRRNRWLEAPNIRRILRLADALPKLNNLLQPAPADDPGDGALWTGDLLRAPAPHPHSSADDPAAAPAYDRPRDAEARAPAGQPASPSPSPAQSGEGAGG